MPIEAGPKTRWVPQKLALVAPRLVVLGGAQKGEELPLGAPGRILRAGSSEGCEIRLPGLAPVHAELRVDARGTGIHVRDLSAGHTRLNGLVITEAVVEAGGTLELGGVELRLGDATDGLTILPSTADHFGPARGRSLAMREVFGLLEVIAPTTATVLLLGETGTGKDVLARAIHGASPRAGAKLLTLDCGAIAPTLIEAELFGYERGAFTGADTEHVGAFESAAGGTLFLDEIGELPLDVQPRLLRAIDEREIQRVGGGRAIPVDVRIVAATKRDLEEEVRRGRFREDLYFRLAVVPVTLPPLRDRREDIPLLVDTFARAFADKTGHEAKIDPNEVNALLAHDWPGNVRELKNTVERALWLAMTGDGLARFLLPTADALAPDRAGEEALQFDPAKSFSEHKESWEEEFERRYLGWLLARASGSISKASRLASMDRKHLRGLLRRHGLVPTKDEATAATEPADGTTDLD
ncbi:sigma 54-interacting transcriptional regulator [Myxococcota bacterium]|nr:sigma 54-interacting transcriptional regulator [Myxococcota bacterium]